MCCKKKYKKLKKLIKKKIDAEASNMNQYASAVTPKWIQDACMTRFNLLIELYNELEE